MGKPLPRSGVLRHVPNVLSGVRMAAVPLLAALAYVENERAFTWVLIPALLTDIADGLLARLLSLESRLGAVLDSVADSMLLFVSVYGIWVFHPEVIRQHPVLCGLAVGLWAFENVLALGRYRRLSSFHTYLSKIVANVLGLFIAVLFVLGLQPWLFYLAAVGSIVASLEELLLLGALPEWRADVRGLWWVLQEKKRAGFSPGRLADRVRRH
jgi:CDP-diacylglycerol--glycerol-3-phosphate 3-phosphatidyltransferase